MAHAAMHTIGDPAGNQKANRMKQEMLINVSQPEECRIAIVEDGVLEELYIERTQPGQLRRQYLQGKGRQSGAEHPGGVRRFRRRPQRLPAHQRRRAAILSPGWLRSRQADRWPGRRYDREVDMGDARRRRSRTRTASDLEERRRHAPRATATPAAAARPGARPRIKPPIQDILRRGDEVLVQVIKEGIGTKGPTLSTYISIPGRYLVLMPALGRVGVSRKIEDDDARRKLRDIMLELNPPKGLGFIVRTAGVDRTKRELSRDLAYLLRLWKVIVRRIKKRPGPCDIYEESDMIIRTIRDIFTGDVDAI